MKKKTKHLWVLKAKPYINMNDAAARYTKEVASGRDKLITDALENIVLNKDDIKEKLSAVGNSNGDITFFYDHKPITLSKVELSVNRKKGTIDYGFNYYIFKHKKEDL